MVAMRPRGRGWASFLVLMLICVLALPGAVDGETGGAPGTVDAETSGAPGADIVLLLDRSGSMQKSDPDGLAVTGAKVLLGMLDPADRVAVVAFDTTARTLLPLSAVGDGAPARAAIDRMGKPAGEWTDIKGALARAVGVLDGQAMADRQPAVLLFTDGRPEVQQGGDGLPPGYREELAATISRIAGRNIPVFTVGLGQGADFATMGQIARGTWAEPFAATSATQVVRLFQDVLSRIKERHVAFAVDEELAPGQSGQVHRFQVPPYTRLLTLTAVGGQVRIKGEAAGGTPLEQAPGLKSSQGGNYQVVTVPNPAPGDWVVQLEGTGRVEGYGQTESALRLTLTSPQPFSQVAAGKPFPVIVTVDGDPDPQSQLVLTAQDGSGEPVRLERRTAAIFQGELTLLDGRLSVWATRAGSDVARREFRIYPAATPPTVGGAEAEAGRLESHRLRDLALAAAGLAALAGALLGFGGWRWRRRRTRQEVLGGRLGSLSLTGCGREARIGAGPVLLPGHTGARLLVGATAPFATLEARVLATTAPLATLEARLAPRRWAPLAGLGLAGSELRIYIHPAPGIRLQVNGRPAADGRLYHGDEVQLGSETYTYNNAALARRPKPARFKKGQTFAR